MTFVVKLIMTLFDTIYLDYPVDIPSYVPDKIKNKILLEIAENGLYTQDFDSMFMVYHINNNGKLFFIGDDYIVANNKTEQILYHGHFEAYTFVDVNDSLSLEVRYDFKFTDGWLVSTKMIHPTEKILQLNELL